ncbi:hypothetical protein NKH18_01180 [Streptomyces sp. M10(2022)]
MVEVLGPHIADLRRSRRAALTGWDALKRTRYLSMKNPDELAEILDDHLRERKPLPRIAPGK